MRITCICSLEFPARGNARVTSQNIASTGISIHGDVGYESLFPTHQFIKSDSKRMRHAQNMIGRSTPSVNQFSTKKSIVYLLCSVRLPAQDPGRSTSRPDPKRNFLMISLTKLKNL
jgi:hypothetical protein